VGDEEFISINGTNGLVRWWFVEDAPKTLESEWDQVQLQTNWKLEHLLKFSTENWLHCCESSIDA